MLHVAGRHLREALPRSVVGRRVALAVQLPLSSAVGVMQVWMRCAK